uniref:hypothetical protein n=1 Tax=Herbidospora sakaeratensis TaxID=564415 RepID=UPI000783721E|nr:hypothetical protein [Herbidospora sakaeratensis]
MTQPTTPLSIQVFNALTHMDCHPGGNLANAVNATSPGTGRDVYKALATHLGLNTGGSATDAADAVYAWEDLSTSYEIRATLLACGWAERRRERDAEEEADLARHIAEADAAPAEQIAAELHELNVRPIYRPTRWDVQYREHLEQLHRKHGSRPAVPPLRECCAEATDRTSHWHCPRCDAVVGMYGHEECDRPVPVDLADALPQDDYISAVVAALNASGIEVSDFWTEDSETEGTHCYLDAVITLAPIAGEGDDDGWPDGLLLLWEWHTGREEGGPERGPSWRYAELHDDGSNETPDDLMVAGYASPEAVVEATRKAINHELGDELIGGSWEHAGELAAACEAWGADEAAEPPARVATIRWIPGHDLGEVLYVVATTVDGKSTGSTTVSASKIDAHKASLVEDGWAVRWEMPADVAADLKAANEHLGGGAR